LFATISLFIFGRTKSKRKALFPGLGLDHIYEGEERFCYTLFNMMLQENNSYS